MTLAVFFAPSATGTMFFNNMLINRPINAESITLLLILAISIQRAIMYNREIIIISAELSELCRCRKLTLRHLQVGVYVSIKSGKYLLNQKMTRTELHVDKIRKHLIVISLQY